MFNQNAESCLGSNCRSHSSWLLPASGFSAKTRPLQKQILNTHQTVMILDLNITIGGGMIWLFPPKKIDNTNNVISNTYQAHVSVSMSVCVCVCFQSDECGVHNCISNTHRAHESPVTIYGHFPLSPYGLAPRSQKINQHSGCKDSNRNIDIS